ncbi:MAG: hypothetical protein KIT56_05010 [Gammaproteobacteria bacterium]|nr:hypothetical protein [Gammaproteobacteria bacterium]MCW5583234.1 hypothetical protein [Gammaproteobacteria bacterium]
MILQIIDCYLSILVAIGTSSIAAFIIGLYFIFKKKPTISPILKKQDDQKMQPALVNNPSFHDMTAIAGDDVMATQLDLARAYMEAGRNQLAKKILEYVVTQGTAIQQQEALQLLSYI